MTTLCNPKSKLLQGMPRCKINSCVFMVRRKAKTSSQTKYKVASEICMGEKQTIAVEFRHERGHLHLERQEKALWNTFVYDGLQRKEDLGRLREEKEEEKQDQQMTWSSEAWGNLGNIT